MKSKSEPKTKPKDPNEERFYRFASAIMAVPKKELDKELPQTRKKKPAKECSSPDEQ
jgi:hypothetical protein